jgi:hypothetical protein
MSKHIRRGMAMLTWLLSMLPNILRFCNLIIHNSFIQGYKVSELIKIKIKLHFAGPPFNFIIYFALSINNPRGPRKVLLISIGIYLKRSIYKRLGCLFYILGRFVFYR